METYFLHAFRTKHDAIDKASNGIPAETVCGIMVAGKAENPERLCKACERIMTQEVNAA